MSPHISNWAELSPQAQEGELNQAHHDRRSEFEPSAYERPIVRVKFVTPNGEFHQTTITSSWMGDPDLPGSALNPPRAGCSRGD